MSELIQCSKCRCKKLPEFFTVKVTTGRVMKCCNACHAKKLSCDQCEFKGTRSLLTKHIKGVHERIKDQQCPQCEYKCAHATTLSHHIKSVHDQIKDHQCPRCEARFFSRTAVAQHVKAIHDQVKDYECGQCEYKCAAKGDLKKHVNAVHDKIRDHQCPHCELKCAGRGDLNQHIKGVHDKIKDHQCPKCNFQTSYADNLIKHMSICTGNLRMSSGEFAIKGVLEAMHIAFVQEMRFADCRDIKSLPFDFFIPLLAVAIEFDGRQHFEPVAHFGGQEHFDATQRRDAIKNAYCATNGIRLLRIKYTDFERIQELIENFITQPSENSVAHLE